MEIAIVENVAINTKKRNNHVGRQGSYAFVSTNDFGISKQMKKADISAVYNEDRKENV